MPLHYSTWCVGLFFVCLPLLFESSCLRRWRDGAKRRVFILNAKDEKKKKNNQSRERGNEREKLRESKENGKENRKKNNQQIVMREEDSKQIGQSCLSLNGMTFYLYSFHFISFFCCVNLNIVTSSIKSAAIADHHNNRLTYAKNCAAFFALTSNYYFSYIKLLHYHCICNNLRIRPLFLLCFIT